jgi:signal transduction histidine kinase
MEGSPQPSVETGGLAAHVPTGTQPMPAPSVMLGEQLKLLCRQWIRVPVPVFFVCLYIGYLAWDYANRVVVVVWGLFTVAALLARALLCLRLGRSAGVVEDSLRWSRRLSAFAFANGFVAGSIAWLLLPVLPAAQQALLVMILCCWGTGAVATSGPYPPAYYAFAGPFFGQLMLGWTIAGAADRLAILSLIPILAATALVFARDSGLMVLESIRLRFANEKLLAQKEQLIALLRSAFDKAEAARVKSEEANRSKSQFLASASHDLRQPLHALSLLTALLNEVAEDARVREVGQHIDRSVQSLDRLFSALLDLSKLDAGAVVPEPRDLDMAEFIERLSVEYRPKAENKALRYAVDCAPVWVRADPILLERILRNLLENAVRFTGAGDVAVRFRRSGADGVLSVSDTGIGIPKEEHGRIFEEFYQLQNSGRDRQKGLGLGLSVVKRLAELLGYRVALNSNPGRGSMFSVVLPGAVVEAPGARTNAATRRDAVDVSGLKVLLVEDDAEVRNAMDLTLRGWGCEPLLAASLEDASAILSRGSVQPDVMISDLRLANGASGVEAIRSLRARFGVVPAALVTGDIASERLSEVGAAGLPVLHKPVQAEALRELLFMLAHTPVPSG